MAEIKVKMDKTAIIVSSVVGSLGLLSTIMGFAGIADPSPGLGICAGIFLLIAQITVSAVGGCCGCCASRGAIPSETKRIVGIICAVGSWVTAVIACVLFFVGAGLSGGMLAGGAVLTLVATALNITSVIMMQGQPANAAAAAPVVVPVVKQPTHDPEVQVNMSIPAGQSNDQKYPPHPEKHRQAPSSSPTAPLLQENREAPQSPPPSIAQDNGTHAQNQVQQSSPEGSSVDDAARRPATEPVGQSAPRAVAMAQPHVLPPHEHTQPPPVNGAPQYASVQEPLQVESPVRISAASAGNGSSALKTTIRNELAKATIRFTEKALEHALFSNGTATAGDVILNMMTADPAGADAGATDYCGDSCAN
ncbi:unnamed protein product [Urochloa decumbens]|uniref:Uncharacterized protein n=1 Tax=Urochloa decumbens TaxID=240449 RepID=A0ABC9GI68_9POAL